MLTFHSSSLIWNRVQSSWSLCIHSTLQHFQRWDRLGTKHTSFHVQTLTLNQVCGWKYTLSAAMFMVLYSRWIRKTMHNCFGCNFRKSDLSQKSLINPLVKTCLSNYFAIVSLLHIRSQHSHPTKHPQGTSGPTDSSEKTIGQQSNGINIVGPTGSRTRDYQAFNLL